MTKLIYALVILFLGGALCKEESLTEKAAHLVFGKHEPGLAEKAHDLVTEHLPDLESLQDAYEKAKDTGHEGIEKFMETLKEQRQKIEDFYRPHREKSWNEKLKEQYEGLSENLRKWQCQAEERLHHLRFGDSAKFNCETQTMYEKAKDQVVDAKDKVFDAASGVAQAGGDAIEAATEAVKSAVNYDELEKAFYKARDQGTEGIRSLVKSVQKQRADLERLYNDVIEKAAKTGDAGSEKSKAWLEQFKKQAGDNLRKFRSLGDDFEQQMQDFIGSDHSRWGWFGKLNFLSKFF